MSYPIKQRNRLKWGLGCTGVAITLIVGVALFVLIVTPLVFRGLSQSDQDRVIRHFAFMRAFAPTQVGGAAFALPTVVITQNNAIALLATDVPTTPTSAAPSVPTGTPFIVITATPSPTLPPAPTTVIPLPTITAQQGRAVAQVIAPPTSDSSTIPIPVAAVADVPTNILTNTPVTIAPAFPTNTSVLPSATTAPTLAPSLVVATALPTATDAPLPLKVRLSGLTWEPQGWNNCGPANLVQVLRYYKWQGTQTLIASVLKPNKNDKNVSPWELVYYVNSVQKPKLKAINRYAGNLALIKRLIAAKFAVITESGFYDPDNPTEGWIGHYLTITAYDDSQGLLTRLDTFKNEHSDPYSVFDGLWQNFDRQYVVIYPPEREAEVKAIIGPDMDTQYNAQHSLDVARAEATANKDDPFAWYNVGTSFTLLGKYKEAAVAFDQAFTVGGGQLPYRIIWYQFWPFEAYYKAGRYPDVMRLVNANFDHTKDVEESYYWRGMVEAAQGQKQAAIDDFNATLANNPHFADAMTAHDAVQNDTFKASLMPQ